MEPGDEQQLLKSFATVILKLENSVGGERRFICFLKPFPWIKPQISHLGAVHFQMTL